MDHKNLSQLDYNCINNNEVLELDEENELTQHQQQILDTITEDNTNTEAEFDWELTDTELHILETLTTNGNTDEIQNSTVPNLLPIENIVIAHNPLPEEWDITEQEPSQICNPDNPVAIIDNTIPTLQTIPTATIWKKKTILDHRLFLKSTKITIQSKQSYIYG
jgi:hypothetical protein